MMKALIAVALAVILETGVTNRVQARLAITEVMAESSTNSLPTFLGPDYWELTNFGTNAIHLDGYGFSDDKEPAVFTNVFFNLTIKGGESIIFCRSNGASPFVRSLEDFKAWWGEGNLPTDLQLRFYTQPGLSPDGDQLWLRDPLGIVVDMVTFGASIPGRSMTYDTETGLFGSPSLPNVGGSFRAANGSMDVGSPGSTAGPVPLRVLRPPASQTVDGCGAVEFSVLGGGMPPPGYQWFWNGAPVPGASEPKLSLPDTGLSAAGEYRALLDNGVEQVLSAPATLTVNTLPLAPRFTLSPIDMTVFPGQTGRFSVEIRGYPCVSVQWASNGLVLAGETNRLLSVAVPYDAATSTNLFTLTASNSVGTASASARLAVVRLPCLKVTETMSSPNNDVLLDHKPWFEVTNCDTDEVDLKDYRFRDADLPGVAFVITNRILIKPGESVVFVESMSREAFVKWWGADQLPPDLQVVTWRGWGLSKAGNDIIHLWNCCPNDPFNTVAIADQLEGIPGFSQETENVCDVQLGCDANYSRESILWEGGAFLSNIGDDVGSPGYTANPPPRILGVSLTERGVKVRCRVLPGKDYQLHFKNTLLDVDWIPLEAEAAIGAVLTLQDSRPNGARARFYRLEELP